MPGRPAELTVGRRLQAGVFLHPDGFGDGVVLDGPQVLGGQAPVRELLTRPEQALGPQQAPDMIGTERRCRATHETFLALGSSGTPAGEHNARDGSLVSAGSVPGAAPAGARPGAAVPGTGLPARARTATRTVAAMTTANRARPPRMYALPVTSCEAVPVVLDEPGLVPVLGVRGGVGVRRLPDDADGERAQVGGLTPEAAGPRAETARRRQPPGQARRAECA